MNNYGISNDITQAPLEGALPGRGHAGLTDTVDTVVIGGGQAGLSLGYHLARQHRDFVILDAHHRVGDSWRSRWDSLRLFSPAKYDALPGLRYPGDQLSFPTKDEQADYLEGYAARFHLPVHTGVRVDRLSRVGERFIVASGDRRWEASRVVVATGGHGKPVVPGYADRLDRSVLQLHSTSYLNPHQLPPGPVLVVGLGNSGAEIAREVSRTHPTVLAGKPTAEIPVKLSRATARFIFPIVRFVNMHVLTLNTPAGRRAAPNFSTPLVRTKRADLRKAGVRLLPRLVGVRDGRSVVEGGEALAVSTVIWCTGFRSDFDWIDLPVFDAEGRPRQHRGIADSCAGLYFLGQEFLFAAGSTTITGVRRDARYLARALAAGS